jgi:hypothetical protein
MKPPFRDEGNMAKRKFLSALVVPVAACALIGGGLAAWSAVTAGPATAGGATVSPFGSLSPSLVARLSQGVNTPVIVVLKSQLGQAPVGTGAASTRSAAVSASQSSLLSELGEVGATGIKQFTLVDSVAATVSAAEAQWLKASPAVAAVIPDATVTIPESSLDSTAPATGTAPGTAANPDRSTSAKLHTIPGACAPNGKSYLAPEGLALTSTASSNPKQPTARSLGFTGAGVKVAFIADGVDPDNVNFIRANGKSAFVDYKDFSGDGPNTPTAGGEAFLDANTIAGQGRHVYNVNGFSAESATGSCDVTIQGVAPGVSLVGLDIFAGEANHDFITTNSVIAQAINYAVETDHVNVLNESFGNNGLPDSTVDVTKMFDDAAVKAGVVVSVSSGDSGTTSTIASPASDPNVISVGATTQFQAFAQANLGGTRYLATTGWLDDNISAFSSSGVDEAGATMDLVAPGALSWASCDASSKYSDCINDVGKPSVIEEAGGTSESAPFVSGAAALVIQAYRKTHDNKTPSPALVKQILLSTASDLGDPADEQGAGLLNAYKAVQAAESVGKSARTGSTLLASTSQLDYAGTGPASKTWNVTFTNTGSKTQTVRLSGRTLSTPTFTAAGSVTLSDSASNQFKGDIGQQENYDIVHVKVPAGQSRLDVSIAYPGNSLQSFPVELTLVDPKGRLAAESEPQGLGNYGNVDVRAPVAGTWSVVILGYTSSIGGYNGKVYWQAQTQRYVGFGSASPSTLSIAPGASKSAAFTAPVSGTPGDVAGSVVVNSNLAGTSTIPVIVRTLVNVTATAAGHFSGTMTGGNGRGAVGQNNFYEFTVPAGTPAITASVLLKNDPSGQIGVGTYLVSPDEDILGYGQNYDLTDAELGATEADTDASVLHPVAGTWTLIVDFADGIPGTEVSDPFSGSVSFAAPATVTGTLPDSASTDLPAGTADTIPVTIENTGTAAQDYYIDARLTTTKSAQLVPLGAGIGSPQTNTVTIPETDTESTPVYFVPTHSSSITVKQTSTVPAMTDLSTVIGDPDVSSVSGLKTSSLCATSVSATDTPSGGEISSGLWSPGPTECGPYKSLAKSGKATTVLTVTTRAFDPAVTANVSGDPIGDLEELATNTSATASGTFDPIEIAPGAANATAIDVVITPSGAAGTVVTGTLYIDAYESGIPPYGQGAGDEVAAIPYEYTIG